VSEPSDTEPGSVVFLGRKSFRMQVVGTPALATGAGAIPTSTWDTPTERIIERRRGWPPPSPPAPKPALAKSTIVGISLITFASGVLVSTAFDRLRAHGREQAHVAVVPPTPPAVVQTQTAQLAPVQIAPAQAAAPAPIVEPLTKTQPQTSPAAPAAAAKPATTRARTAPPARSRRPAASEGTSPTTELDLLEKPSVKPPTPGKWVDPFAE
jgi:hypothetical protein